MKTFNQPKKFVTKFILFGEEFSKEFDTKSRADFFLKCLNSAKLNKAPTKIQDAFEKYLLLVVPNKIKSSQSFDKLIVERFVNFLLINKKLEFICEVELVHFENFQNYLVKKMKPVSVNRNFNTLKHCFTKFVDWGFIQSNPARVRSLYEESTKIVLWSEKDLKRFKSKICSLDKLLIDVLWQTGARLISVVELKKSDICAQTNTITFISKKGAKRKGKRYTIPASPNLIGRLLKTNKNSEYIFVNSKGNPYKSSYFRKKHAKVLKSIGNNKPLKLHNIRHTFATFLSKKGVSVQDIAKFLGHADFLITQKYIIDNDIDSLRRHL